MNFKVIFCKKIVFLHDIYFAKRIKDKPARDYFEPTYRYSTFTSPLYYSINYLFLLFAQSPQRTDC